jgi:3-oxoacyl-[acyl-carrier protein] reductase
MDLGIRGKWAIVCASSKGLGRGCAEALAAEGVNLVLNARTPGPLGETAAAIRAAHGVEVIAVACDITTEDGRAKVLAACPSPDILVNNAGGPPPGMWTDWGREDFLSALDANMLTPIALITAVVPGMMERGWGRVVNITSQSVKAPLAVLGLSNAARSGLTGYVAGTARQIAKSGVIMNNLLPGSHATDRIRSLDERTSQQQGISVDEARAARQASNPTGRDGDPGDFGRMCAFLCSEHVGFMVAQNVLLDGGGINVTM